MIASLLCSTVGFVTLILAVRGMTAQERRIITAGWALHLIAAVGIVIYHEDVYHGGDMFLYMSYGKEIAKFLRVNFGFYVVDVVKLILQKDNALPVTVLLEGTTSGTMMGITAFLMFLTDDSSYGASLLVSFFGFSGCLGFYRAARDQLSAVEKSPALVGTLLVPSVAFWTSGIIKEAMIVGFLGLLVEGLVNVFQKRRVWNIVSVVGGAYGVSLIKPYTLFPLALAIGAWFYARRERRVALRYKLLSVVIAFAGLLLLTRLFPAFGIDKLGESAARIRQNYSMVGPTGSGIDLGDDGGDTSLVGQLKFAPIGLLNSMARPFIFEMRNATMAIAALEMTVLTILVIASIRQFGARRFFRAFGERPYLLFSATFALAFGAAVGLATANLGSLSRYRVPMMPFYVASVLAVRARLSSQGAPARSTSRPSAMRSLALRRRRESVEPVSAK